MIFTLLLSFQRENLSSLRFSSFLAKFDAEMSAEATEVVDDGITAEGRTSTELDAAIQLKYVLYLRYFMVKNRIT